MFEINDFKNLFIESSIIQRLIFKFFLILEQYDESPAYYGMLYTYGLD